MKRSVSTGSATAELPVLAAGAARSVARVSVVLLAVLALAVPLTAQGHGPHEPPSGLERNFDARIDTNRGVDHPPTPAQLEALNRFEEDMPGAVARFDRTTGATRTLNHPTGALTGAAAGAAADRARAFVDSHLDLLGLGPGDLEGMELTDHVVSDVTGASHLYWRQSFAGIPLYNGQLQVNVDRDGRVRSVANAFLPGLAGAVNTLRANRGAAAAVVSAADDLGFGRVTPEVLSTGDDPQRTTLLAGDGLSQDDITARLFWLPINRGTARLVWNFQIQTLDGHHWFDLNVDAVSGKVWTRFDWVNSTSFRVYEQPVESPEHTSPLPPSDARTLAVDPEEATASPNGWFDSGTTIMDGNNVHACADRNANNGCDTGQPSCGSSLDCDFAIDLSSDPANSIPAAITNLFYWNNIIHDIQYQHGFTESAGNFQESNFGRGGAGSDSVNADAQDGSGTCNANFATPADGGNPRMQMFVCTNTNPSRDGDYDNGVIVHEYGHGISIRQVGGPSNSSCLNNNQQPGEGWSDWLGLVYTARSTDTGPQARGMGAYLFGLDPNGGTIRDLPYSTDNAVNNWTYESIAGASIPHGVGSRWGQAIWEVYWALVDKHGFDPNLYNSGSVAGAAGNTRAMTYINEGFKNTACSPTFLDARDGIIQAAQNLHGGEDVCDLWTAFAAFGLGTDASTGGSNSTTATNGFSVPSTCGGGGGGPVPPTCPAGSIDFNSFSLTSYSNQNASNNVSIADGGDTLVLRDNTWVRSTTPFNVTSTTRVEFYFAGGPQGEIHAIGFDADDSLNDEPAHFQFWGTQNWTGTGNAGLTNPQYSGSGDFESFSIEMGSLGSGSKFLVFTNDNDAGSGNEGRFACVRVVDDGGGGGTCTEDNDFDAGDVTGWFNDGASTCTTGSYVLGTPDFVENGGVVTQVGGDHTTGTGNAIFTAANTGGAGSDDVDGGNCILGSPTWSVANASTLSVWYFHGQRDAGDDSSGDFFRLEYSLDGGSSWNLLASNGDSTSNAAWAQATASIPAGSSVKLRMQASDGPNAGDLVEAGLDDVSICEN